MAISIVYLLIFGFFVKQSISWEPFMDFYEHKDQGGMRERIFSDATDYPFASCYNLGTELSDKASSVNTHGNCVTLYSNYFCSGDKRYLAPSSSGHNYLGSMDFNDQTKSFSSCNPDESAVTTNTFKLFRKALFKGGPEFRFWKLWISLNSPQNLEHYLRETERRRFISWQFMMPEHLRTPDPYHRLGDQYQYILRSQTALIPNQRDLDNLLGLQGLANGVLIDRETRLEPENWRSRSYVVHRTVLDRWRELSRTLNETIDNESYDVY